jgi:hypothetical protein
MVGFTAINWIVLLAATLVWPLVAIVLYFLWRWSKTHEDEDAARRKALLEAAAAAQQAPDASGPAA